METQTGNDAIHLLTVYKQLVRHCRFHHLTAQPQNTLQIEIKPTMTRKESKVATTPAFYKTAKAADSNMKDFTLFAGVTYRDPFLLFFCENNCE